MPRKRIAVFIDGDFWHGRTYEKLLASRKDPENDYWVQKIKRNMERDAEQIKALDKKGWKYIRIWEKDIMRKSKQDETLQLISRFLKSND